MADILFEAHSIFTAKSLTVEELEEGLRQLDRGEIPSDTFWDENLTAFRQAMVVAIGETSGMLTGGVPTRWRQKLEAQLKALRLYVEIVDLYVLSREAAAKSRLN